MSSSNYASLSDIIFSQVEPDERCDAENTADALLRESSYEQALSSYLLLDPTVPRLTAKIAYCEWKLDKFDDAFLRLTASIETLDVDILPALKGRDSCSQTAMSCREYVPCGVYVAIMSDSALTTSPFSYSQACSTFRTVSGDSPATRTRLGGIPFVDHFKHH